MPPAPSASPQVLRTASRSGTEQAWSVPGAGIPGVVNALAVYDDGTGPALYTGGMFTTAGLVPCQNMAKWNGAAWSQPFAVGPASYASVYALRAFDDATGPKLYVGGAFSQVGATPANGIARWNGTSIEALGSGVQGVVLALGTYDSGSGPSLFLGGAFSHAGGISSNLIAEVIPARPVLAILQPGGAGNGVSILDTALKAGFETYNFFSLEPAPGGPGTGPYVGPLRQQHQHAAHPVPPSGRLGAVPFHGIVDDRLVRPVRRGSFRPGP